MSFFTNQVKTNYLESKVDKKLLTTEFHIPNDSIMYSNLRLSDVFLDVLGAGPRTGNTYLGAYALFDSIEIFSKNTSLSKIRDFTSWAEWTIQNNSNEDNLNTNQFLTQGSYGFVSSNDRVSKYADNVFLINDYSESRGTGWLNLQMFLGVLRGHPLLSTYKLPDLKVVIRYNRKVFDYIVGGGVATDFAQQATMTLAYDEITDMGVVDAINSSIPQQLSYTDIENETINISGVAFLQTQNIQQRLKGFNNKYVNRLLIKKEPITPFGNERYAKGSLALTNETFNLLVNGSTVLPFGGVGSDRKAQLLAHLVDTWGEQTLAPAGNYVEIFNAGTNTNELYDNYTYSQFNTIDALANVKGSQSYIGLAVQEKIQDLQIILTRKHNAEIPLVNEPLNLKVFCEVRKMLDVSSGRVMYE